MISLKYNENILYLVLDKKNVGIKTQRNEITLIIC